MRRADFLILGLMLATWIVTAQAAPPTLLPDEQNNVETYQRCNPSVVNITAITLRSDFFFEAIPQKGVGSGAIVRADGYVVTNHHVVGNAVDVEVTLFDKTTLPAKVVGTDPDSDLSILKILPKDKKLIPLEYANPDTLMVGQKVLAIGNPFGLGGSLSVGVISSLNRDIRATTDRLIKDIIQTDAAINPGNSGGPLLDSAGKLIGINTQIVSASGGSHGVGFAISVKTMKKIVDQLINFGQVLRPELGIEGVGMSKELFSALEVPTTQGVMITALEEGGAAHKAGLRPANRQVVFGFRRVPYGGDVIYKVDSTPVATFRDIMDYISDKKAGDTLTVHYFRGGKKSTATVKLSLPTKARARSF